MSGSNIKALAKAAREQAETVAQMALQMEKMDERLEVVERRQNEMEEREKLAVAEISTLKAEIVIMEQNHLIQVKKVKKQADTLGQRQDESAQEKKKVKKIRKRSNIALIIVEDENEQEKNAYTSEEVSQMSDYLLCKEFIRLTGRTTLDCTHCKKPTPLDNWIHSIRKRCEKKGLDRNTPVPKTCDKQQAVNSICNPINNKVYPVLRSPSVSDKKKQRYLNAKAACFKLIEKNTAPYKY
jgi:hypothetical protein